MADATTIRRYGAIAWLFLACVLALLMVGLAPAFAQVKGTASYRERIVLPPDAVFEATLEDVSKADARAEVIGLTEGKGNDVALMLRRLGSGSPSTSSLESTYWKLTHLGDQPIPVVRWAHEPHLILHPDTRRASGSGGCNRFTGSYEVNGDRLAFGETAGTMKACLEGMETEKTFLTALRQARRAKISRQQLELLDAEDKPVARFDAVDAALAQPAVDSRIVTVEAGVVGGAAAGGVISWKGIPYAAPPVGNLRWRLPQPVLPWTGVKETSRFGPACMQTDNVPKSEDCLTLNVWRPAQAAARALPVMVWMHGGAMVHGGAPVYRFDAMAAKGVMIVSMNFRLGRFGYFAHPALGAESPDDVRGNYGYMDQLAALQWVHINIAAFGGDPDQVTIFGESAGGGSVLAHLVSPMSRGLFQRAILQSPGTPGPRARAIPSSDLATAEKIAIDWSRSVGVTSEDAAALKQLRALPAEKLLEGVSGVATLKALAAGTTPPGMAMSIVDGRFLPERPEAALAAGRQAVVPVIIGANDRDLAIGSASTKYELFGLFGPDADPARKLYDPLGNQTLDELRQQVFADRTLVEPARHFANEMARAGQTVWLYRFAYVPEAQRGQNMGGLHAHEIPFAMNIPAALVGQSKVTPTDRAMADLISAYWVSFALTTDPNGGGRPVWPRHDRMVDQLMHFTNSGVIVGTDPLKARLDLWERVWNRDR